MILLIGQVPRGLVGREAFQEMDYGRMFGDQAKLVIEINHPACVPEHLARAFATATSGRPGPIIISVPEDMLTEQAVVVDACPYRRAVQHPSPEAMTELRERLASAQRPLVIAGGGGWTPSCGPYLQAFADRTRVPLAAAFRRQDCVDNSDEHYVGDVGLGINPDLDRYLRESDLVIAVGPRLGEVTTGGYTRLTAPVPKQALVHILPSPEELGRVYQPVLSVAATMESACRALAELDPVDSAGWAEHTRRLRRSYLRHIEPVVSTGAVNISDIIVRLRDKLAPDAIYTNGAGNYAAWLNRFSAFRNHGRQLAPTSGAMGYSVPAAVAASLLHPDRTVISFSGDGCFMMTCQEMATAAQHRVAPIFIIANNSMYGTIRMHQERRYPGRVSGTGLKNPDFVAMARSYGGHGELVECTEDFDAAFDRAKRAGCFALIELRIDPEDMTPTATLSQIRAAAEQSRVPK